MNMAAELGKFEELVGGALKKFDEQALRMESLEKENSSLKGKIETLEHIIPAKAGFMQHSRGIEIPWESKEAAQEFSLFCKLLAQKNFGEVKNMVEGTDADGGYFVPVDFKPTLLRIIEQYGVIRSNAQIVPMTRDEMQWPVFSGGWKDANGAVAGPVYWVDEAAAMTQTWPQFSTVTMTCKKLAALVPTSGELLQDSVIPIANLIATLVGEYLAKEEDRVGFVGSVAGGDKFDGALTSAGKVTLTSGTNINTVTVENMLDCINSLNPTVIAGSKWYMNRTTYAILRKKRIDQGGGAGTGEFLIQSPIGPEPANIWGYPVELVEAMPAYDGQAHASTRYILFGNMKNYYFADKMQLSVASTDIVGFANFLTHFRFVERIGMKLPLPDTLACIKTAAA
jgi:HK97 family phage major capsid protein